MAGYNTIGLLTRQAQNHYLNFGFVPVTRIHVGSGEFPYNGSAVSRRFFVDVEDNDFFRLCKSHQTTTRKRGINESVWFWLGYRVFVEYFDENVLVDVQYPLEKTDVSREDAVIRLAGWLSRLFRVEIVGDNNIINVHCKGVDG